MRQLAESRFISHYPLAHFFLLACLNWARFYVLQLYVWTSADLTLVIYFIYFLNWFLLLFAILFLSEVAFTSKMSIRIALEAFLSRLLRFAWLFFLVLAVINWEFATEYLYLTQPTLLKYYLSITSFAFYLL